MTAAQFWIVADNRAKAEILSNIFAALAVLRLLVEAIGKLIDANVQCIQTSPYSFNIFVHL